MSFIEMDLGGVNEQNAAPEGTYDLRISNAQVGEAKSSGNPQIVVGITIEGHSEYLPIRHYLGLPSDDDDDDMRQRKLRSIKRFCHLFDIAMDDGINTEDFLGATASALVTQDEPNDNGDIYNRLIVPRIKD